MIVGFVKIISCLKSNIKINFVLILYLKYNYFNMGVPNETQKDRHVSSLYDIKFTQQMTLCKTVQY